jgi:hypothetical protein
MTGRRWALFVLGLALAAGAALAGVTQDSYTELAPAEAPAAIRGGGLAGSDSQAVGATPLATSGAGLSVFSLAGNPTIAVHPRLSAQNAMVGVRVHLWHHAPATGVWTQAGIAGVSTATAGSSTAVGGMFQADSTLYFDGGGATHYEPRIVGAPTMGATVDLVCWSFGAQSRRAR